MADSNFTYYNGIRCTTRMCLKLEDITYWHNENDAYIMVQLQ